MTALNSQKLFIPTPFPLVFLIRRGKNPQKKLGKAKEFIFLASQETEYIHSCSELKGEIATISIFNKRRQKEENEHYTFEYDIA